MTHGSLFSGIGGFDLAAQWAGIPTLWQVEKDAYCRAVLRKHFPNAKQYEDIKNVGSRELEPVDIISGGFPCQPFSVAGKQRGRADDRFLWHEMLRVIAEVRPTWVIAENVAGIIRMEFDNCIADLESEGYSCQAVVIPACGVNAPHRRNRVWIIAHAKCDGSPSAASRPNREERSKERTNENSVSEGHVPNTDIQRLQRWNGSSLQKCRSQRTSRSSSPLCNAAIERLPDWAGGKMGQPRAVTEFEHSDGREIERNFRGISHGVSRRVDRLRSLGNAIVPQVAYQIFKAIKQVTGRD